MRRHPLALLPITLLVGASAFPFPATAVPGVTPISVTINSPADGAVLPPGPVTVTGQATIDKVAPDRNIGLVYVMDVSRSTTSTGCQAGGVPGNRLDCEKAGIKALNAQAVSDATVAKVGVVAFAGEATSGSFPPDGAVTAPEDARVAQVVDSARNVPEGLGNTTLLAGTVFSQAVREATSVAGNLHTDKKIVVFLSDGDDGEPSSTALQDALNDVPDDVVFKTFAIGTDNQQFPVKCGNPDPTSPPGTPPPAGDTLAQISFQTGGGLCTEVKNVTDLLTILPAVIDSQMTELNLKVDRGDFKPIIVTPPLPRVGKATVPYSVTTDALGTGPHTLCMQAKGVDFKGEVSAEECHTVIVNAAPVVKAGGPYTGTHGKPVPLNGTLDDDEPRAAVTWSVPAAAGCTFADVHALNSTVTCTEQGTFPLTLTADDGLHPPVSDPTTLTITNARPVVSAGGPYSGLQNQPVKITGTASDADDTQLTTRWSVAEGTPCTFADATALSTTVTCTDHGTFDLTLSASDGKNPAVTATTTVRFDNQPPKVSAGGPYTGQDNVAVPIKGTVTDPDSPGLTTRWTIAQVTGDPAVCAFRNNDPTRLDNEVTCTRAGLFTLTLTVEDKESNTTVRARADLRLDLRTASLSTFVNPAPGFVGGDPVVVTHTVRNTGVSPMKSVKLITTLPAGLQPVSASCAIICDLGTLNPGQIVQVTLTFATTAAMDQPISALLTTEPPDLDQRDNATSARIVVRQPTLSVDPSIGAQGFVTHATGKDFPAGARIRLHWSVGISETPGEVVVGQDGTFTAQVLVFPKDTRGLRTLSAFPVQGPTFGEVRSSNPFLVIARSLKPLEFIAR